MTKGRQNPDNLSTVDTEKELARIAVMSFRCFYRKFWIKVPLLVVIIGLPPPLSCRRLEERQRVHYDPHPLSGTPILAPASRPPLEARDGRGAYPGLRRRHHRYEIGPPSPRAPFLSRSSGSPVITGERPEIPQKAAYYRDRMKVLESGLPMVYNALESTTSELLGRLREAVSGPRGRKFKSSHPDQRFV